MAHVGEKIKGSQPPHGGCWRYDTDADELELIEAPTTEEKELNEDANTQSTNIS